MVQFAHFDTVLLHAAGRAGNKGTAITFIAPDEDQYAGDLVKALKESKATIPEDLLTMAREHTEKVKRGEARAHGSGYGGSGFKFDSAEEDKEKDRRKVSLALHGGILKAQLTGYMRDPV